MESAVRARRQHARQCRENTGKAAAHGAPSPEPPGGVAARRQQGLPCSPGGSLEGRQTSQWSSQNLDEKLW